MMTLIDKINQFKPDHIKLFIVLISLAVATQVQLIQHGWINTDSVLYLEAAKLFAIGQWQAGYDIYNWPFYSLCITATHLLTKLGIHQAAQLLNIIFFGIACASFLTIIELAGGKQLQLVSGGLILLSSEYLIGGVLEMLMRDEGFWAFYLLSLVFLVKFYQRQQLKHALLWQIFILIAVLFRIEAILHLIFLPLVLFLVSTENIKTKILLMLKAYGLHILMMLLLLIAIQNIDRFNFDMLGRLNEILTTDFFNLLTQKFSEKKQIISTSILDPYLDEFATASLILTFAYVIVYKTIKSTGIIAIGLVIIGFNQRKIILENKTFRTLCSAAFISTINMSLIITKMFVLSGRYVISLSFIILIFASFYLGYLFETWKGIKNKKYTFWVVPCLIILLSFAFIKNLLPKADGYNFRQDAMHWLSNINKEKSPVFYDDKRLRYFANEPFINIGRLTEENLLSSIDQHKPDFYTYLVLTSNPKNPAYEKVIIEHKPNFSEIKRFYSHKKNKSIVIYKRQTESGNL